MLYCQVWTKNEYKRNISLPGLCSSSALMPQTNSFCLRVVKQLNFHIKLKALANGKANLHTQACDGWPNGTASRCKLDTSCKKAISVQPCACYNPSENDTETSLNWVANLRANLSLIKVNTSYRKCTQVVGKCSHKFATCNNLIYVTVFCHDGLSAVHPRFHIFGSLFHIFGSLIISVSAWL